MNKLVLTILTVFLVVVLGGCGNERYDQPTIDLDATVAAQVQATLTASAPDELTTTPVPPTPTLEPAATSTAVAAPTDTPLAAPTPLPAATPTPVPVLPIAPGESPPGEPIPFAVASDPAQLADSWGWSPGSYAGNDYELNAETGALTMVAGPETNMWDDVSSGPVIQYNLEGDFDVQVRVDFAPDTDEYRKRQLAGLGIGSPADENTWFRVAREGGHRGQRVVAEENQAGRSREVNEAAFNKEATYLRIRRVGAALSVAFSTSGRNWVWMLEDHIFDLPEDVRLFLFLYSTASTGAQATFSDLMHAMPGPIVLSDASGSIPFVDENDPSLLSTWWTWTPGGSNASDYQLVDGALDVVVGPETEMWEQINSAPQTEYWTEGDFEVQVRMDFSPETDEYRHAQIAGIGIRSSEDSNTWIRFAREGGHWGQKVIVQQNREGKSNTIVETPYNKPVTHFMIKRTGSTIAVAFSENGRNWVRLLSDHVFDLPDRVKIFLFPYSTATLGNQATFSEFQIHPPGVAEQPVGDGALSFSDPADPALLDPAWGWSPGENQGNDLVVGEELILIAGPETEMKDTNSTAPQVVYPLSGNFEVQAGLEFDPQTDEHRRLQAAGIGIRSPENHDTWLAVAREGGHWGQKVIAMRNQAGKTDSPAESEFGGATTHFRLVRQGSLVSIYYSTDGATWQPLVEDFVMALPDDVELFLYLSSTASEGATGRFTAPVVTRP